MTTAPVIDCDPANTTGNSYKYTLSFGAAAFAKQSWASTWDTKSIDSYTAPTTWPTSAVTWDKIGTGNCGAAWASADDCAGITTWAFGADSAPTATKQGSYSAYHWLADKKPTDNSKVFQIEDQAVVNVLVNLHYGIFPANMPAATGYTVWDFTCNPTLQPHDSWFVGQFTYTMGASGVFAMTAAAFAAFTALF